MVTKRLNVLFHLRKINREESKQMMVYMRVTLDSNRFEVSTNRSVDSGRWNKYSGRAIGTKEEARELNAFLDAMKLNVQRLYRESLESEEEVTIETLRALLKGFSLNESKMLLSVFQEHNL